MRNVFAAAALVLLWQAPWSPAAYTSGSLPTGAIVLIVSGACPQGYVEEGGLAGKFLLGTTAAGEDIGDTGGSDAITPEGSVTAPVFAGAALAGHAHGTGSYASSAHSATAVADHASHTHTYTQVPNHVHPYCSQTATSGGAASYEHGAIDASSAATECSQMTNNPTGGVATGTTAGPGATLTHDVTQPANHTLSGAGTPAGSNTAPTFTGTQFDNRPAWTKVIFCRKS